MNSTAAVLLVCLCFAAQGFAFEISFGQCPTTANVVQNFQVSQYMGKWYEIQRFAQVWELLGKCSTAEYTLDAEKGRVNVKNTMQTIVGSEISQEGYAEVTSKTGGAELNVVFDVPIFGKREANYWVLDTDYSNYAVVYSCSNLTGFLKLESAWVLGREKQLSAEAQTAVDKAIEAAKLKKSALKPTKQDC